MKVLIIDTSVLCVLLQVPGKENCETYNGKWNIGQGVEALEQEAAKENALLVLPLATIIETGNHIAQANTKRYEIAQALVGIIRKAAKGQTPWTVFTNQYGLWKPGALESLADSWPAQAAKEISMGDATILVIRDLYQRNRNLVEILTGDKTLETYPQFRPKRPRRG